MADFLDEKRKEIDSRLRELRPLVDEYNRLEKAAAALAGVGVGGASNGSSATPRRRRTASAPARKGRRGRPRGSGARSKQALELVRSRPGITIAELADAMGIKANYLYRVLPNLASEGQVKRRGKGWHPA
jgi:sugar-specific transcriptional regulator TrmB